MFESMFQSTTIPVLEQVVGFAQARHNVLAGNIANLDTPGYRTRDLSVADFQERLQSAIEARNQPSRWRSPGEPGADASTELAQVARHSAGILRHDEVNVSPEQQVSEMVKNQIQHNTALTIMISQFQLLSAAISERA